MYRPNESIPKLFTFLITICRRRTHEHSNFRPVKSHLERAYLGRRNCHRFSTDQHHNQSGNSKREPSTTTGPAPAPPTGTLGHRPCHRTRTTRRPARVNQRPLRNVCEIISRFGRGRRMQCKAPGSRRTNREIISCTFLERIANHCRGVAGISDRMRSACGTAQACKPVRALQGRPAHRYRRKSTGARGAPYLTSERKPL